MHWGTCSKLKRFKFRMAGYCQRFNGVEEKIHYSGAVKRKYATLSGYGKFLILRCFRSINLIQSRPSTAVFHGMPCSPRSCSIHTNREVLKLDVMRRCNLQTSNPRAYYSVAKFLGVPPQKCAMVAAHIFDLRGAKGCDYKTV